MTRAKTFLIAGAAALLSACSVSEPPAIQAGTNAPGAPGAAPTWSNAEKIAIGSSYEAYDENGQYSAASPTAPISKVWFSLGKDRVTEVMWGLIHEAQLREIQFLLVGPDGVSAPASVSIEIAGGESPSSPAPTLVFEYPEVGRTINITTFADPDRDVLIMRASIAESLPEGVQLFAYVDAAMANTGSGDQARVIDSGLHASEGASHLFAHGGA